MKRRILINILLLSALFGFSTVTHGNPDAFTRNYAAHEDVPTAALSPNGHLKAFVRSTPGVYVDTAMGEEEATEIWTSKPDGGDAKLLLRGHSGTKPENTLAGFSHLQFSPDGRRLYFLSAAWVTSRAIHFLELSSQTNEYVCPGNSLEVIQRGEYAG